MIPTRRERRTSPARALPNTVAVGVGAGAVALAATGAEVAALFMLALMAGHSLSGSP